MPLEIRELVIKVTIEEHAYRQDAGDFLFQQDLKKKVVNDCVEMVLAKLSQLTDR